MLIFSVFRLAKQPNMLMSLTKVPIDVPYEQKFEYLCPLFLKILSTVPCISVPSISECVYKIRLSRMKAHQTLGS